MDVSTNREPGEDSSEFKQVPVIDVSGTNVTVLATGKRTPRKVSPWLWEEAREDERPEILAAQAQESMRGKGRVKWECFTQCSMSLIIRGGAK